MRNNSLQEVRVFVHSWDVDYQQQILHRLQPVRALFEPQRTFQLEAGLAVMKSMWYSRKQVFKLVLDYEKEHGYEFDVVESNRLDRCFCSPVVYGPWSLPRGKAIMFYGDTREDARGKPYVISKGITIDAEHVGRLSDSVITGKAPAMHKLANYLVSHIGRLRTGTDPHATLALAVHDVFGFKGQVSDARVAFCTAFQDSRDGYLVRKQFQDCDHAAMTADPAACFKLHCSKHQRDWDETLHELGMAATRVTEC